METGQETQDIIKLEQRSFSAGQGCEDIFHPACPCDDALLRPQYVRIARWSGILVTALGIIGFACLTGAFVTVRTLFSDGIFAMNVHHVGTNPLSSKSTVNIILAACSFFPGISTLILSEQFRKFRRHLFGFMSACGTDGRKNVIVSLDSLLKTSAMVIVAGGVAILASGMSIFYIMTRLP